MVTSALFHMVGCGGLYCSFGTFIDKKHTYLGMDCIRGLAI